MSTNHPKTPEEFEARKLYNREWKRKNNERLGIVSTKKFLNMDERRDLEKALFAIAEAQRPMTVRQIFYRATVAGLIEKTEKGYRLVMRTLSKMRLGGTLKYG